jgi:hypothetical protein
MRGAYHPRPVRIGRPPQTRAREKRTLVKKLALTLAALAAAAVAAPAHAAPLPPVCRQATYGGNNLVALCLLADAGQAGTTVAPTLQVVCVIGPRYLRTCDAVAPVVVGTTGFVANPAFPLPAVDPATGSVHVFAGTVGSLWVNGTEYPVETRDVCVGDPSFC